MNRFKGTKGKWIINQRKTKLEVLISSDNKRICEVKSYSTERFKDPTTIEADANAQLIATAPELLEALQRVEKAINTMNLNDRFGHTQQYIREAINKALN